MELLVGEANHGSVIEDRSGEIVLDREREQAVDQVGDGGVAAAAQDEGPQQDPDQPRLSWLMAKSMEGRWCCERVVEPCCLFQRISTGCAHAI